MATIKSDRAATIYDVAARAGVSHQTVSRYIAGYERIRPETRERVKKAVSELDYRPNMSARALATNRSRRIAAITTDLISIGPSQIVQGVASAARAAGYLVDIIAMDAHDTVSITDAVALLRQQELAGIVIIAVSDQVREIIERTDLGVPVHIDSGPADLDAGDGQSYNAAGMQLAVRHLIERGHREIVHLAGPTEWLAARNRATAFDQIMHAERLPGHPHLRGDWTARSGHEAVQRFSASSNVTALVSANDQMALGAIHALAQQGLRVPTDVSVTGFDDVAESRYYLPALTTVRIDFERQGVYLFDSIAALINGVDAPIPGSFMHPELIERDSTSRRS